ncbi:MAG: hypothetical protein AAF468_11175 [Pseudomonadota bacterium]
MPLQNRVLPTGEIVRSTHRGEMMGNRGGRIHEPGTKELFPRRRHATRQWISCVTEFKNRQREVMGRGYTELFFLDEVTALAAGHRPCFECRRKDARAFAESWQKVFGLELPPKAGEMDRLLHDERLSPAQSKLDHHAIDDLPDGSMIEIDSRCFARHQQRWLKWDESGYSESPELAKALHTEPVRVLTPKIAIAVLSAGYQPVWHSSASSV